MSQIFFELFIFSYNSAIGRESTTKLTFTKKSLFANSTTALVKTPTSVWVIYEIHKTLGVTKSVKWYILVVYRVLQTLTTSVRSTGLTPNHRSVIVWYGLRRL